MESNFAFLRKYWSRLAEFGAAAERQLGVDNNACVNNLGGFAELLTEQILISERMENQLGLNQFQRIEFLQQHNLLPESAVGMLHHIRMLRNEVDHAKGYAPLVETQILLQEAYSLACWFMKTYSGEAFTAPGFVMPGTQPHPAPDRPRQSFYTAPAPTRPEYVYNAPEKNSGSSWMIALLIFLLALSLGLNFYLLGQI